MNGVVLLALLLGIATWVLVGIVFGWTIAVVFLVAFVMAAAVTLAGSAR